MDTFVGGIIMEKEYKAGEGKIWKSKLDGAYLSDVLILGKQDKLENYEQVDPPVYDEGEEDA